MLCNAIGNQPPLACFNTHSITTTIVERAAANVAINKTKANPDNPAAAVVAPTRAVVKMDSTEATVMVLDTTKAAT
jgi:hypothetical protein